MTPHLPEFSHEHKVNRIMVGSIVAFMLALATALVFAIRYQPVEDTVWRIGITNWPGFDPLFLASQKGFLKENGLGIRLIPVNSITDMRTAFERGLIDGYTGSIQDVADSLQNSRTPSQIVLVTDYSSGGDQLLADPSITTIAELKGKRIGIEITSSIGRYILSRALEGSNLTSNDFSLRPYSQAAVVDQAIRNNLDAVVTYEPFAGKIQAERPMRRLFDSTHIPNEIIDVLVVSPRMMQAEPDLSRRMQKAWQSALDYTIAYPEETIGLFAQRYGITTTAYKTLSTDTSILNTQAMQRLTSSNSLGNALEAAARVLNPSLPFTAANVSSTIAVWFQQEAGR